MYDASPPTPTFIREMREYERRKTLHLNGYESSGSVGSETSDEYNLRIRRQNCLLKWASCIGFASCVGCCLTLT